MSWAVVIERCELVGPSEDVHRGSILLGCVREEYMEDGRVGELYLGYDDEFAFIES